ncbi:uncharacterized protein M6B38_270490 [Iris pallida]|uniref:Uncharacterized protein n=2 Tax=Iris pallida TaxID=29817 RepID=A0AAX6H7H7_IRIPA|nr:uncharacterized protein M6B38_325455 [Iris pallida]KAJ6849410.1 uncharacterized protein M6B38_270490 [Iris pallida]
MLRCISRPRPPPPSVLHQLRWLARPNSSRGKVPLPLSRKAGGGGAAGGEGKSEWWAVDGEMHEIGDGVPHRERFVIPRDNLPNRRRKQMRDQFMRRTRLVLKDSEHEPWCRKYMELYNEMRENWERLYWDEGYSKKLAQDHANYDSAEDDELDFSPYRRRRSQGEINQDQGFMGNKRDDTWDKVGQIRDKFEYDRERRMREKAFAPMNGGNGFSSRDSVSRNPPFDAQKFFRNSSRDG